MTQPPPLHLAIIGCFIILGISTFLIGYRVQRRGTSMAGKPTITPWLFYTGKLCVFGSWFLLILAASLPGLIRIDRAPFQVPLAFGLMAAGTLFMIWAFFNLGAALRLGLPLNDTKLATKGLYRISRNPIYLGVILINAASCVFFPGVINICISLAGVIIHHFIILGEERFLRERFGEEWNRYARSTGRYFII